MDTNKLMAVVTIILTLSIATERLVEIVRGLYAKFFIKKEQTTLELPTGLEIKTVEEQTWDKARVSLLSVVCGIVTAFLASPILAGIFKDMFPADNPCGLNNIFGMGSAGVCGFNLSANGVFLVFALGLLASGGSSLWNSILEYLVKIKNIKGAVATRAQIRAANSIRIIQRIAAENETKVEPK